MNTRSIRLFASASVLAGLSALTGCGVLGGNDGGSVFVPSTGGTPTQAQQITREADKAYEDGELERAEELYRRSLGIVREQPGALNNLGNLLVDLDRTIDADEVYKIAIEIDGTRPEPYTNRGRLWLQQRYPREAIEHFDKALEQNPRWLPALRGKSTANHMLSITEEQYLTELRTAMILESDAEWRAWFDRERARVEEALEAGL